MKSVYCLFLITILFASCSTASSQNSIATSVAFTVAAQITSTNTSVPATSTSEPTSTNIPQPTKTKIPTLTQRPTNPPIPMTTYILETGWCMLDVTADQVSGKDPKTVQWCNLDSRKQIQLAENQYMELTLENLDGDIQVYCSLFSVDGTFIMSDMDTTGTGKVTCPHK
jgi:hypothetical protein